MKCEGPSKAPCKRCVKNKVECVFGESQGKARQILWTKRTEELEGRVSNMLDEIRRAHHRLDRLESFIPDLNQTFKKDNEKLNSQKACDYTQQSKGGKLQPESIDWKVDTVDKPSKQELLFSQGFNTLSSPKNNHHQPSNLVIDKKGSGPGSVTLLSPSLISEGALGRSTDLNNRTSERYFSKLSPPTSSENRQNEKFSLINRRGTYQSFPSDLKNLSGDDDGPPSRNGLHGADSDEDSEDNETAKKGAVEEEDKPQNRFLNSKKRNCLEFNCTHKFTKAIQAGRPGPRRTDMPDTFENVRLHSPLMLAVGCCSGAKGCKDEMSYRKAKTHVIELVIDVLCYRFFAHDKPQSYQDVVAIIGCIVHCGLSLEPALVVDYAEHLRLRDVFDKIPNPRWKSERNQRQLLSIARTFIGVYIFTVLFR
ncbi:hypothetical protein BY996DRAFT_6417009 [Phakopsora pachyrhizi]|nr:hypothetical protein BY996DRAFT_6417009 [Phakopsora pachyrhizi]